MSLAEAGAVVLALNSGSSSLKFGLYQVDAAQAGMLLSGEAEAIGGDQGSFHAQDGQGARLLTETARLPDQAAAIARIGRLLSESKLPAPVAVGHRIVHGGPKLRQHCLIDETILGELQDATAFAPIHMPAALSVIRFAREHFPGLPQVACFDTAFHADLPDVAGILPLPKALRSEGIRRYGFHGLSCESIVAQLEPDIPRRLVIAHLGNGASITAVRDGTSIDTSMGLTPSGGVIMGTRSGDLDPGVLIYLMRQKHLDADGLETLIDQQSGLAGISGTGSDMRSLHRAAASNADAALAIRMFCYAARKQIAAMIAALGGIDLLVFTGGIGEHDPAIRAEICAGLSWAGVSLDPARCSVRVLPSQEDKQIARHSRALIG